MGNCLCVHKCVDCDVPYDYYINENSRMKPSCRVSRSKYHDFQIVLLETNDLYSFMNSSKEIQVS